MGLNGFHEFGVSFGIRILEALQVLKVSMLGPTPDPGHSGKSSRKVLCRLYHRRWVAAFLNM